MPGYLGRLRKKFRGLASEDAQLAWRGKCCFTHPVTKQSMSYLIANWGGVGGSEVSVGCFICHAASGSGAFASTGVSSRTALQVGNLSMHASSQTHVKSFEHWSKSLLGSGHEQAEGHDRATAEGLVSGISDKIPRLDRFVQALDLVASSCKSYAQFRAHIDAQSVGSALEAGGDYSEHAARRMIFCMSEVLCERDRAMMSKTIFSSIAIDKTQDILLLYARLLTPEGLYDCLIGCRETLPDVQTTSDALQELIKKACTQPVACRKDGALYEHPEDSFLAASW